MSQYGLGPLVSFCGKVVGVLLELQLHMSNRADTDIRYLDKIFMLTPDSYTQNI